MSDSPVSDQAPEDLRSDTTKKKSAGTDRPDSQWTHRQWHRVSLSLSPQRYYCLLYSGVQMCLKPRGLRLTLLAKLVMFGIKILMVESLHYWSAVKYKLI